MIRAFRFCCIVVASMFGCCAATGFAVAPADTLAPDTTKGFLSVPDIALMKARFNQTQLGDLVNDPIMQPFIDDLKGQLKGKLNDAGVRVGLTIGDLESVYGGEVAVATIQPNNDEKEHALAVIADVTGHEAETKALTDKVDRNMAEKKAVKSNKQVAGIGLSVYTHPKKEGESQSEVTVIFVHADQLVATDHLPVAEAIAKRLAGQGDGASLSKVLAYVESMRRCLDASGPDLEAPHVRWFIEPFGYIEVNRAANGGRKKRGTDLLKVLEHQGFDAIQGVGGWVWFKMEHEEILHRSYVYAPAVPKKANEAGTDKYRLAARMLQFPNHQPLKAQPWVPRELGTYITFNWKMIDAFHFSETLVDELAGAEGVFDDVLDGIKNDPTGPQVDLVKDLVAHLGERATVIADAKMPITPQSERLMFAIETTNEVVVKRTIDKAMSDDPNAKKRVFGEQVIWEIINEDNESVPALQIDGAFSGIDEDQEEEVKLPNSAVTVVNGHLLISTHVDFIVDMLKQLTIQDRDNLALAADYQVVDRALERIGADVDSFRVFIRTDEAYRVTYEMLRENRMPESESLLGRALNRILGPDEKDQKREQEIDGRKMPPYQAVRRYLGPAGIYVRSFDDGWYVAGALIHKEVAAVQP